MTYRQALEQLLQRRRFGVRPGLDRMRALLARLGDPQRGLRAVHVAGTNGKGSTAAFLESILRAAGRRTGLYTSPHLLRFTERIRIDGVELDEAETAELAARVLDAGPEATFFEVATAMAFLAFAAHGVEVAVVEAGLGGRLDSTNVLERPLATVVTGVALDHTDVLGPTLVDIAREKAGIFKAGVPAIFACDDPAAAEVLRTTARTVGAPLISGTGPPCPVSFPSLGLRGTFQHRNAALAVLAARATGVTDDDAIARGLADARWPGRLELLAPDLLIDAAHNPDGARTLAAELPALAAGRPVTLVFGVVADKDAEAMLAPLLPQTACVILSQVPNPRARPPAELLRWAPDARVVPDPAAALARARDGTSFVVVAGSIFLVAEVRRLVTGERVDPITAQDPPALQKL